MDTKKVYWFVQIHREELPLQNRNMILVKCFLRIPALGVIGILDAVVSLSHTGKQHQAVRHTVFREPENHVASFHRYKGLRGTGIAQIPKRADRVEDRDHHDSEPVLSIRLVFLQRMRQLTDFQVWES